MNDDLTEEEAREKVRRAIEESPEPLDASSDDQSQVNSKPPTPEIMPKVEVPPLPETPPPVVTVLERMWAWFNGYADQQIINASEGRPVASPFSLFSIVTNWQRYAIGIVILIVIIIAGYFCLR